MAIALALPLSNDLGRSVTSLFLLTDQFHYRFYTFSEKNLSIRSLNCFCKMRHRFPFFLGLRLSVRWFQMPVEGLRFVKTLATFRIVYCFLQSMTKIVCLR